MAGSHVLVANGFQQSKEFQQFQDFKKNVPISIQNEPMLQSGLPQASHLISSESEHSSVNVSTSLPEVESAKLKSNIIKSDNTSILVFSALHKLQFYVSEFLSMIKFSLKELLSYCQIEIFTYEIY